VPANPQALRFSFAYLQTDHPQFPFASCTGEYFNALLSKLTFYSTMPVDHFVQEDAVQHRHTITWLDTSIPDGFPIVDPNELGTDTAWQFCLDANNGRYHHQWRVHGFVVETTFYVVWLDAVHGLLKRDGE
jgi:hypothetical protein